MIGGPGRIRTYEGESQQIYSLPRLTASVPTRNNKKIGFFKAPSIMTEIKGFCKFPS